MSEYLPQDVMMKILSKLPPKPLIKFRMVSKSWYFMISSHFFINLHTYNTLLLNPPTTFNQIMVRRYSKVLKNEVYSVHTDNEHFHRDGAIRIEYPFRDDIRFYNRVIGSCNGVLCLLSDQFGRARDIHLWNPVIMRKLKLPPPQSSIMVNCRGTCKIVLGFGFDVERYDYKVVRIAYVRGDCEYILPPMVEVYSLCRRSWHTVECVIPKNYVPEHYWSQAFINGKVHWVAFKINGRDSKKLENVMMVFDLTLEVFDEMPLPEPLESELTFHLEALDLNGALAVVQYDKRVWSTSVTIWVMRKYGYASSWSKDYCIDHDGGIGVRGLKDSFYVGPYRESLVLLAEGVLARQRLPSEDGSDSDGDSDGDMECESSVDEDEDEDDSDDSVDSDDSDGGSRR